MCIVTVQLKSSFRFASYHPNWSEKLQNFTESIGLRWEISLRNSSEKFSEKFHCFHRTSVAQLTKQLPSSTARIPPSNIALVWTYGKEIVNSLAKVVHAWVNSWFSCSGLSRGKGGWGYLPQISQFLYSQICVQYTSRPRRFWPHQPKVAAYGPGACRIV